MGAARRLAVILACAAAIGAVLAACGGDGDDDDGDLTPAASLTVTTTIVAGPTPTPAPLTEFKVAFVNLFSPLTLDDDPVAGETFQARIKLLAEELRKLDPDLIAFNEASRTGHGDAIDMLVAELKMEFYYARANPWYPGQTKEQSDLTAEQAGFEEGELILSRWAILSAEEPLPLNPLVSESGERRVLLHAVVKAPAPLGEVDVYVTHLTGGGEATRSSQAADVVQKINDRRSGRPILLLGDITDSLDSATFQVFRDAGFEDAANGEALSTCCRQSVVGDQPELTTRPDIVMYQGFPSVSVQLFGQSPVVQHDGKPLYASDHNGLFAVFSVGP